MAVEMTLAGSVQAKLSVTATRVFSGLATGTVPLNRTASQTVSSAATTQTMDMIWQNVTTIAGGGAAVDIDLNDLAACGGIMEYWGEDDTVRKAQYDRVHVLYIKNTTTGAAAGASVLRIGLDGLPFEWFLATPATDAVLLEPGGFILSSCGTDAGWAVTQGANDVLQIANLDGANAASYEIVIIGESVSSAMTTTTTVAPTTTTAAATTTTVAATTTTAAATTTTAAATTTTAAATTTTAAATTTTAAATTTTAAATTTTA